MELHEKKWFSINDAAKYLEMSEEDVECYLETGKLIASIKLLHTNNYLHEFGVDKTDEELLEDLIDFDSYHTKHIMEQYDIYLEYINASRDDVAYDDFYNTPDFDESVFDLVETDINYIRLNSGIFNINSYDSLAWDKDKCDLGKSNVRLTKVDNNDFGQFYVFFTSKFISKNQIIISKETLVKFRNLFEINKSQSEKVVVSQAKRPWEDENSGFFSEELATAVKIWERVFGHKPDKPKTKSFKADIELILDARRDLKEAAKKRLAILLNPEKFKPGGRPNKSS